MILGLIIKNEESKKRWSVTTYRLDAWVIHQHIEQIKKDFADAVNRANETPCPRCNGVGLIAVDTPCPVCSDDLEIPF